MQKCFTFLRKTFLIFSRITTPTNIFPKVAEAHAQIDAFAAEYPIGEILGREYSIDQRVHSLLSAMDEKRKT
jgi:hypothetical protein